MFRCFCCVALTICVCLMTHTHTHMGARARSIHICECEWMLELFSSASVLLVLPESLVDMDREYRCLLPLQHIFLHVFNLKIFYLNMFWNGTSYTHSKTPLFSPRRVLSWLRFGSPFFISVSLVALHILWMEYRDVMCRSIDFFWLLSSSSSHG